jgi:hypothetical protein
MIISIAPVRPSRWRRAFAVAACAGALTWLLLSFFDSPSPPSPSLAVAAPALPQAHVLDRDRQTARPSAAAVLEDAGPAGQAPRRGNEAAPPVSAPTPQRPELPFRFLGKLDAGGGTSLVLYGRGRTLTVHGPGPLDDDYAVDAIEDGYLVLRHLSSGTSHILELVARQHSILAAASGAETPQD